MNNLKRRVMLEQWSEDRSAVKIFGDYSPHPVTVEKDVVDYFGDCEKAYHAIHHLRKADHLPRPRASAAYPFTMRDIELAEENVNRGERYWRWGILYPSHNEFVRGYYHIEGGVAVFIGGTRVKLSQEEQRNGNER